jgi:hypothetical protein
MKARLSLGLLAMCCLALPAAAQDVEDASSAKRKRLKDNAADFWIYDDIDKGYARAAETKKPLLISFRCVP